MQLKNKIRKIWHDVFYRNTSKKYHDFALNCQDVACRIDLHEKPQTLADKFRFWFHLSLCQACKNYYDMSQILTRTMRQKRNKIVPQVEDLNASLLTKHSQKNK